ncbi:hypothetical protein RI129_002032 [Pyrocoelia pectoralis]|uniref:Peptidase S1 domain-containing protein n=1 Tax=Pyrocoelia pectoralis TaxID=417401 RepID=A0AAN7VEJ4_9COLE
MCRSKGQRWRVSGFFLNSTSTLVNLEGAFHGGSMGRNIRNLPCVSRRSNERGVCMFAIDCLKANGTHLGTCIDGFYFGSCCHIKPAHEDSNSIDTAIIPAREPPSRMSSTTKHPTSKIGDILLEVNATAMTRSTSSMVTSTTTSRISTTSRPSSTPSTTLTSTTTTAKQENITATSEDNYKLSTFQTIEKHTTSLFNTTSKPTKISPTTSQPISLPTKPKPPTFPYRPRPSSTLRPIVKPVTSSSTTKLVSITKPVTTSSTTKLVTTSSTTKPVTTSITTKPLKLTKITTPTTSRTTKPIKIVTKPTKPTITKKPIIVSSSTLKLTKPPTSTTTSKPSTFSTTTKAPSSSTTTEKHATPSLVKVNTTSTIESNEVPPVANPATNEIEQVKPLQPPPTVEQTTSSALITWSIINEETTKSSNISQEWKPLTTPDGWVLLPSLSTLTPVISPGTNGSLNNTESNATPSEIPIQTSTLSSQMSSVGESVNATSSIAITTETPPVSSPLLIGQGISGGVNMSDFTDVCGRRMYPEARIVGGERSTFGKWPWQISLRQWRTSTYLHKCGAALLNENWAITAAHCVDNVPPSDLLLRLGEHDLSTDSEPYIHQERRVQIVAAHPQFDPRTFEYDLALLRFYEPVQFQPNIIPVCVPTTDENFVSRTAYVTGWGRLYEDGPLPSVLQQVAVPVINNTICESMYRSAGYIEHIPHIFICAGWRKGGFDSCEGDSGGPMVIQREDNRFLLAGVISWGIGCAEPNQPGVYTRISEFRDWINQILQF